MHQRTASSQVMAASGIERNHMLDDPRRISGDNCVRRHLLCHNDLDLPARFCQIAHDGRKAELGSRASVIVLGASHVHRSRWIICSLREKDCLHLYYFSATRR